VLTCLPFWCVVWVQVLGLGRAGSDSEDNAREGVRGRGLSRMRREDSEEPEGGEEEGDDEDEEEEEELMRQEEELRLEREKEMQELQLKYQQKLMEVRQRHRVGGAASFHGLLSKAGPKGSKGSLEEPGPWGSAQDWRDAGKLAAARDRMGRGLPQMAFAYPPWEEAAGSGPAHRMSAGMRRTSTGGAGP